MYLLCAILFVPSIEIQHFIMFVHCCDFLCLFIFCGIFGKLLLFFIFACLKAVVGGKQGHAPCKILLFQQALFLCPSNFMEIIRLSHR